MILHSERGATGAPSIRNGVVVHDSEGSEGDNSSEQLIAALHSKGDRPSPTRPGQFYGAGYQAVATEEGGYVTVADDNIGPYHAGGGINPNMWSICIPGRASQTREQWLDYPSRQYILGVAHYIVDRWNHDRRVWPLEFRSGAELAADKANISGHPSGWTTHKQVTESKLTSTDHYDPGPNFPIDVLVSDIHALAFNTPTFPPGVDMPLLVKPYDGPDLNRLAPTLLDTAAFVLNGATATWVDNEGDLAVQQMLGTTPKEITPVPRSVLKSYRLVGSVPPAGYGYIVPGRGAGTVESDFRQQIT